MKSDWKKLIDGCFGVADGVFAGHPADAERAQKMLYAAFGQGITSLDDFLKPIVGFMEGKRYSKSHIQEQIKRIKNIEKYFPYD